jgi:AcrR family transcriptional regulator
VTDAAPAAPDASQPRKRRPYRRGEIQRAAIQLFHKKGFAETSMDDIGAAIGMAGPSIYRHFASKAEILESALRPMEDQYFEDFEQAYARYTDPQRRLEELVEVYVHWLADDPVLTAVTMQARQLVSEEQRRELDRVDRRLLTRWVDAVCDARPDLDRAEARLLTRGALQLVLTTALGGAALGVAKAHDIARRGMLAALRA